MAKHKTLASLFTDIAAAIRAKTGKTDKLVADDFPTAIAGITTGVNTSDATVTAADVANGVIAYGKDGKVTGTVTEKKSGNQTYSADALGASAGRLIMRRQAGADVLIRAAAYVQMRAPLSDLGNAVASDVRAGKTFTSSAGLTVEGTNNSLGSANAVQYDWGAATRINATQVKITITRDTKPQVLAWEIQTASGSTGADGVVLAGMGMRSASTGSVRYNAISKVANAAASTGYVVTTLTFTTGVVVSAGSRSGTWNITIYCGGGTVSSDLSYIVNLLTGEA